MIWLKQSTPVTIKCGPFVDDADGKTAETALSIAQADIRLSKNGGDVAQTNNSAGATHDELGYYDVPLNSTDTNTLGALRLVVHKSGALPVWQDFMVVPANIWDSYFGSDYLQVDATQILGTAVSTPATAGVLDVNVRNWKGSTAPGNTGDAYARLGAPAGASVSADVAAAKTVVDAVKVQTDKLNFTGTDVKATLDGESVTASTVGDKTGYSLASVYDAAKTAAQASTALSNATWTDTKAGYLDASVSSRSTLTAQAVWEYTTRTLTGFGSLVSDVVTAVWSAATRTLSAFDFSVTAGSVTDKTGYSLAVEPPTAGVIADAVWDEARSSHVGGGTFGEGVSSVQGAVTDSVGSVATEVGITQASADKVWTSSSRSLTEKTGYSLVVTPPTAAQVRAEMDSNSTKLANLDAAVSSRSTLTASDVWSYGTRTLTSFGTLVSSIVDAVWSATTRTLTGFGFTVVTNSVLDKTGYSLTSEYDAAKLAASQDSVDAIDTQLSAVKAKTDTIPSGIATVSDIPTAVQNADALLTRNMQSVTGEASRSPLNALRALRNKFSIVDGVYSVTKEDDTTEAWSADVTGSSSASPITSVDPR